MQSLTLIFGMGLVTMAFAQPRINPPTFDVASVRPNRTGINSSSISRTGGRIVLDNASLRECITFAYSIDLDAMVNAAVRVGERVVWYAERHAVDALSTDAVDYSDGDLYLPHLAALDLFASWGWLAYTEETKDIEGDAPRVFVTVKRKAICDKVAARILERGNPSVETALSSSPR